VHLRHRWVIPGMLRARTGVTMPTNEELEEWCFRKAYENLKRYDRIEHHLAHMKMVITVKELLKNAYDYGFSQGAGG